MAYHPTLQLVYVGTANPGPRDRWDYDSTQKLVLGDVTLDGSERKVLMQAPN